jgi:RNA polymerase sigma factor (sigma-70 family)
MATLHANAVRDRDAAKRVPNGAVLPIGPPVGSAGGVDPTARDPSPSTAWAAAERAADVAAALDRLAPADRDLVVRHYFLGQSHARIADDLGLTVDQVRYRLDGIRARLGEELRGWA